MYSSLYQVAEMVTWPHGRMPDAKFWILETVFTVDGPRTRVTDQKFHTKQEADDWLAEQERG